MYDNHRFVNSEKLEGSVEAITDYNCTFYGDICECHNTLNKREDNHSEQPYEEIT